MKIKGYIKTNAPIHISDGTDGNATATATHPIPNLETGRMDRIPGIKGTVLRGLLRKTADDIVNEQLVRHGVRIPMEVFNALRHGSTSGKMTKESGRVSIFDAIRGHPVMGLFGGGPRSSRGLLVTPWMLPFCQEALAAEMVPEMDGVEPMRGFQLIGEDVMYPKLDVMLDPEPEYAQVIEDYDAKTDEIIAADLGRREGKKSGEGSESTLRSSNLLTYKYMMANVMLHLDLTVEDSAPDHLKGFLLVVLARALNLNEVGGMQRVGIGKDVFSLRSVANNVLLDGEQAFEWDGQSLVVATNGKAAELKAAFDAWHDDGRAWTAETLWAATGFTGIDLSEPAVKKTNGKKAKAA